MTTFLNLIFVWLPYNLLVEMGVLTVTFPYLLLLSVFVYLRFKKPNLTRPFKVCDFFFVLFIFSFHCDLSNFPFSVRALCFYRSATGQQMGGAALLPDAGRADAL